MQRKSASKRTPRKTPLNAEDPACARAWERLDEAEKQLLHAGGKTMETALDGFYDAWLERIAVMAEGVEDGGSSTHLENAMLLLTEAASSPKAEKAARAFLEVAILEVEAAVLRSLSGRVRGAAREQPGAGWDMGPKRGWGHA